MKCSLLVRFHVNDLLDQCEVDVSGENVVVVVTKAESCHGMWAWFEAGANTQFTQVIVYCFRSTMFESHLRQLIFLRKSDCLGCVVLLCLVCLTLLASFLSH